MIVLILVIGIFFSNCKKDDDDDDSANGTVNMAIYDAKLPYGKSTRSNIVDATMLTKCEITFSSVKLKNSDGSYTDILSSETTVDLRQFQGTTMTDLLSSNVPTGNYTMIRLEVSGVSTTYDDNNYSASVSGGASVTISGVPVTQGVPNCFSTGAVSFETPLVFTIANEGDIEDIHLQFDADASTYVIPFTYQTDTFNFAGLRPLFSIILILEEGIQQIMHSPPLGITIVSPNDVDYYGIHTFIDFNQKGGTINSHTSQHVFRGDDGSLIVDAETMITNPNPLTPDTVSATGQTDITADETFHYSDIVTYLGTQGYTLTSGETYYFSLRKTWNITTDGNTYDLTRMCEPIPVVVP